MRGIIIQNEYTMEYFQFGYGPKVMFSFHGFNNNAQDFKMLGEIIGAGFKVISLNIFFHGESKANADLVEKGFQIEDLKKLFDEMSVRFPAEKYFLLGYSLGGRIVLKMLEIYPEKIEKIILIAPDGIRISNFYRFLTRTWPGKNLLKRVIKNPSLFFQIAQLMRKTGLVKEKKYHFAKGNFDTHSKREMVYNVWMILRNIHSKKSVLKNLISSYHIPVYLFFGKYDQIIPPKIGFRFQKGIENLVFVNLLDTGHKMIQEKFMKEIFKQVN